jgi:PAS domain S-box-containing protein
MKSFSDKMKWTAQVLAFALVYGVTARLSLLLAFQNTNASPVWPPSGMAFMFILFFGYRFWPGIVLGAFTANLLTFLHNGQSWAPTIIASMIIATGNALEAVLGVFLLHRFVRLRNPLNQTSDIFRLFGIAMLMCLVPAMMGPTVLAGLGVISWFVYPTAFWTWWLGDLTGILMLSPFFLMWYRRSTKVLSPSFEWRTVVDVVAFTVLLLTVTLGVFSGHLRPIFLNYPGSYLLIPIIVLAAFRFGQRGVGWSIPTISGIAIWGTIHGFGPFVRDELNESLLFLQIFIAVITMTGLVLAAVLKEKDKAQMVLRRNQRDLSDFFENATIGLHRIGPDGMIQWANKAELEMLGYKAEEYIGHPVIEFHVDRKKISDMLVRLGRGETLHNYEAQLRCKDGTIREVLIDANVLLENGRMVYVRGFTRDITDRKQIEKVLFAQEKWFRTLIENSADVITLVNADGTIIYSSPSTTKIIGYPLEEYIGRNVFEFIHLDDLDPITQRFQEVLAKPGNFVSAECRFRRKDGSWAWLEGSGSNMLTDDSIKAVVINCRDITARKKAEDDLRESQERLHGLFESSKDGIAYVSLEGILLDINEGYLKLMGYSKQELIGKTRFVDLTPPEYHQSDEENFRQVLETGQPLEYEKEYIRKDGSRVPVLLTVFVIRDAQDRPFGLGATIKDMTERKKAEVERFRLAAIVDSSSDAIIGKTLDGVITTWNRGAEELYGYTAEEMIGQPVSILVPSDRPNELPAILERLKNGEHIKQLETIRVCKDGTHITVSLTVSPIKNSVDKVIGASTIARDITERKRIEKQLQETARLKSEFTSTVSHELRTPLAISKEALSLLLRGKVGEFTPKQKEILTIASTNIDRLCFLIDDILDFSKIEAGKMEIHKEPWDIVPVVQESCNGWKLRADFKKISLNMTAPPGPLVIPVDKIRFLQILSNLLNNAAKFTPEGGRIDVIIEDEKDAVRFSVVDSGPGIAPEDMPKLFQKFQQFKRTHGPGARGTGLGLSIVKSLVELHGGEITVKSTVGKGSSFIFRLPKGTAPLATKEVVHGSQKDSDH